MPEWQGIYLYGDAAPRAWGLRRGTAGWNQQSRHALPIAPSVRQSRRDYVADLDGGIYRLGRR
jgi:hypothetical protein